MSLNLTASKHRPDMAAPNRHHFVAGHVLMRPLPVIRFTSSIRRVREPAPPTITTHQAPLVESLASLRAASTGTRSDRSAWRPVPRNFGPRQGERIEMLAEPSGVAVMNGR